ncbi:MAG: hypothetical protein AAB367_00100 [Patescibacteria group bacterium]
MIPHLKAHLPLAAIVLMSALVTFSTLWMRDIVRVTEHTQAAELPAAPLGDPAIERILTSGDSLDPGAIEEDLRAIELHAIGEGLVEVQILLGNQ